MATPKRSALGRGLDALISMDNIVTSGTSSIHEIELSQIVPNPDQPRREFDQEALEELASSIRELGIIQPISLRQVDGGNYQIIAGERRYRAAQMAGLETIPAYVRTVVLRSEDSIPMYGNVHSYAQFFHPDVISCGHHPP